MESIWNTYGMVPSICNPWTGPCGFHGISNEFELQIHVLFRMDSMEANSVDKPIKWAVKNSVRVRNRTLDLVNTSRVQMRERSNSWTIWPLKDSKFPSISRALDWSCPKRTSANADARFGRHQQSTTLFLNHHHHPQTPPPLNTDDTVSADGDNAQRCHHAQWVVRALTLTDIHPSCHVTVSDEKPDAREMWNVRRVRWTDAWTPKQTHTHTQP